MNTAPAPVAVIPASIGLRLVAVVLDVVLISVISWTCFVLLVEPRFYPGFLNRYMDFMASFSTNTPIPTDILEPFQSFNFLCIGVFFLYFTLSEWLWKGRTLGKRFVRIGVLKLNPNANPTPPPLPDAINRNLFKSLGMLMPIPLLLIDAIPVFFGRERLSLHDRLSRTIVVDEAYQKIINDFSNPS